MNVRRQIIATGTATTLVVAGLVLATAPATALSYSGPFCSDNSHVTPCILSATIQVGSGTPESITQSSTDYGVGIDSCPVASDPNGGCQGGVGWSTYVGTGTAAGNETWTISFDLGRFVPSGTDTWGVNTAVTRTVTHRGSARGAAYYKATITGNPTLIDDGSSCVEQPSVVFLCGEQAASTNYAYFGSINDNYVNETATQAAASYGTDDWTTSSATGAPLFLGSTPAGTITIPIGNTHLHHDSSVVNGEYNAFLPDALLEYMGIDDPSTITSASLVVDLASSNLTVTPMAGGVNINLSNITWPEPASGGAHLAGKPSAKARDLPLRIKPGVITPTHPTKVTAHRVSATKGRLVVTGAKPRGSKIVGYHASCAAKHHKTITGHSKGRKHLKVAGLTPHVAYRCKARAVAKAGHGHYSKPVTLKA